MGSEDVGEICTTQVPEVMSIQELEQIVMRECEFLSYYIEEYEAHLSTNPYDRVLMENMELLSAKYKAFEKVYIFIRELNGKSKH